MGANKKTCVYCVLFLETIQALFKTNFSTDLPYCPPEILVFALLG